jgi:hypothetical protein
MTTVTITEAQANCHAMNLRNMAATWYSEGRLSEHMQGWFRGSLAAIETFMRPDPLIIQGIRNEINFYCRRASEGKA